MLDPYPETRTEEEDDEMTYPRAHVPLLQLLRSSFV